MRTRNGDVELCIPKTFVEQILKIGLIAIPDMADLWGGPSGE
jgi:hypothetical protein